MVARGGGGTLVRLHVLLMRWSRCASETRWIMLRWKRILMIRYCLDAHQVRWRTYILLLVLLFYQTTLLLTTVVSSVLGG